MAQLNGAGKTMAERREPARTRRKAGYREPASLCRCGKDAGVHSGGTQTFEAGIAPVIRYWRPAEALNGLVSGYHCYSVKPASSERHHDVFYPGWSNLRFQLGGDPWSARIGDRHFDPVPRASLFGPTAQAIYIESGEGLLVGAGLTPLGWSRLTEMAASSVADRIVPFEALVEGDKGLLLAALVETAGDVGVKEIFDAWFLRHFRGPRRGDERIVALHALLADANTGSISATAAQIGIHPRHFARLVQRSFGFTPKKLLRRARFLRTLLTLRDQPHGTWAGSIGIDYHDQSHFIRESHEFLGMAPGQFFSLRKPLNDASTILRRDILGASAQALYDPRKTR